ncbi:MAG: GNAT family N-acetyltransferase [Clostridiales bacterium]|nr:GNAT family N-acetyltransferase [Clostridiales bacterium]
MSAQNIEMNIRRIKEMEAILDEGVNLLSGGGTEERIRSFQTEIEKLEKYYTGPFWREDLALDEEGKLPKDLKRGVLSEDAVYDLLDRNKEILDELGMIQEMPGILLCGAQEIDTGRLLLRSFRKEDAASMFRNFLSDEQVQSMYGEPTYTSIPQVEELIDKYIGQTEAGSAFRWEVIEKSSGECIGQASYFLVDKNNHFGEIEYCIGRAFQGKGYATEATRAVIAYGFEKIGFHKVQICCRPSNVSSKRVIDKCGFTHEGTLRDYFFRNGGYEDRMFFSILKSEYNMHDKP